MKDRVNEAMDHESELSELTKTFIEDLRDEQIINIAKRQYFNGTLTLLTNKHNKTQGFTNMQEVKRYCAWLIEVGAVKLGVKDDPILLSVNPAH